ncbi:hypothetical protein D3C85_374680 [compost metagenome]
MDSGLFHKILDELMFMTDTQLHELSFQVWVTQHERYAEEAIATAQTTDVGLTAYADKRGK